MSLSNKEFENLAAIKYTYLTKNTKPSTWCITEAGEDLEACESLVKRGWAIDITLLHAFDTSGDRFFALTLKGAKETDFIQFSEDQLE